MSTESGHPNGVEWSCRGGVSHARVGWVIQWCSGSYRGTVRWVMQGWGWSYMGWSGVWKISLNNLICPFFWQIIVNYFLDNVGEGMSLLVVALVGSTSVPLRTQATFLLFSLGTNVITMPFWFLYKGHLVITFNIIGNKHYCNNKIIIIIFIFKTQSLYPFQQLFWWGQILIPRTIIFRQFYCMTNHTPPHACMTHPTQSPHDPPTHAYDLTFYKWFKLKK